MAKTCFIIAPIGPDGSPTRKRSDQLCRHVLVPVLTHCGYTSIQRADEVASPGIIGTQIMRSLLTAELVIADLTDHNPNVFYELAVRHTTAKAAVQLIEHDKALPFDVAQLRTIRYNLGDLDAIERCKSELKAQVQHAEQDPFSDNPVRAHAPMDAQESEDRLGYCDVHLESALLPYGTWLAGQYGGDRADCNPIGYWRCSRSECDRCYQPYMLWYFDLAL